MTADVWYYLAALLLLVVNVSCWTATVFSLPGNWGIVLATLLFALFLNDDAAGRGLHLGTLGTIVGLALLGEIIEMFAGAAGAAKKGGSRRGMVLAMFGAMAGSIGGTALGTPLPVFGPILGALGGGAAGAFLGAYVGETWKGRKTEDRLAISTAALVGRLLGTVCKLLVGVVMVVIATVDSLG